MIRRDKKLHVFMGIAEALALLGTCDRKQVGAVIVRDGRCVSWGYNGAPPGLEHCEENFHGWDNSVELSFMAPEDREARIEKTKLLLESQGCRNATHAEANAIAAAAKQGISTDDCVLFVTVSPCEVCARLLIAAGITRVYYAEAYRKDDGCQILKKASIPAIRLR